MDETRSIQEKIDARHGALRKGDHATARRIKEELRSSGVELTDTESGTAWSKSDPIRAFEKHNHDIPGAAKHHVTPEMAARALRSLYPEMRAGEIFEITELGKLFLWDGKELAEWREGHGAAPLSPELEAPLTWPTLADLPEPTFLPEVVNPAPTRDELQEEELRVHGGFLVFAVERMLIKQNEVWVSPSDEEAILAWFGPSGIKESWKGRVSSSIAVGPIDWKKELNINTQPGQ